MSIPFRERNPVPIGAVGLLVIAVLLYLAFNASRPAAHRRRDGLQRRLLRGRRHQARRRRAHRRRQGRQGDGRRPRGRPRPCRLHDHRGRELRPADRRLDPDEDDPRREVRRARPARARASSTPDAQIPAGAHGQLLRHRQRLPGPRRRPPSASTPASWRRPSASSPRSSRTARSTSRPPSTACPASRAPSRAATRSWARCSSAANSVSGLVRSRNDQVSTLIKDADLLMVELVKRRDDIRTLFRNTSALAHAAHRAGPGQPGPAEAGPRRARQDPGPAPEARDRPAEDHRRHGARSRGVYANTLGTGRWFDTWVSNLVVPVGTPGLALPGTKLPDLLLPGTSGGGR